MSIRRILFVICTGLFLNSWPSILGADADLIVFNGKIVTVDEAFSIRSAMAIQRGRILAVGRMEEMKRFQTPTTQLYDLGGRTVMPGLIDSHSHPAGASITEFDHPIPKMESIQDVLDYIRARKDVVPEGEWIWVSQVFLTRLKEQRYPTRDELDEVAPRHAVVFRTGPDASVNSMALRLSGIDENWKVDDGGPGYAEKDPATGGLTGILRSCTRYLKGRRGIRQPTLEQHAEALKKLFADYNRVGITSVAERDASADEVKLYRNLRDNGELTVRSYLSIHLDSIPPIQEIRKRIARVESDPLFRGDEFLRIPAVKTYLDGGMLTGSAFMRRPWGVSQLYGITDPAYRGVRFIAEEKLVEMMAACFERNVQFMAHSVGDGAVHAFIKACEKLSDRFDIRQKRPVICHSNFMTRDAVERVAELGIGVDIQPAWLYLDGRTLLGHFGYERMAWFQPLRALFALGAIAGGGSDHMQKLGSLRSINFYDPWMAIWVTLTRRAKWLDDPLHLEHALSRVEAIRYYTINNAYLLFAEHELGSLEAGKLADFIVLADDILTCPVNEVQNIRVEETYLGGKKVFGK